MRALGVFPVWVNWVMTGAHPSGGKYSRAAPGLVFLEPLRAFGFPDECLDAWQ